MESQTPHWAVPKKIYTLDARFEEMIIVKSKKHQKMTNSSADGPFKLLRNPCESHGVMNSADTQQPVQLKVSPPVDSLPKQAGKPEQIPKIHYSVICAASSATFATSYRIFLHGSLRSLPLHAALSGLKASRQGIWVLHTPVL